MTACGTCPSCSNGVPICVGNVCVAPEEAFVQGSFLFATFAALFNFFVARRDAVKNAMSNSSRRILFYCIPLMIFGFCVQSGYIEIPTLKAIKNSIFGAGAGVEDEGAHGHSHGHAEWHGDHYGHFHHEPGTIEAHDHDHGHGPQSY